APVQAGIARPRHRSPSPILAVDEDDVVELVNRFEAEDERRKPVRLEHDRGEQRRLEAMRAALAHDPAEAAQRGAAARLLVVREIVQEALDREGRTQPRDEAPLARQEQGPFPFFFFTLFTRHSRETGERPLFSDPPAPAP